LGAFALMLRWPDYLIHGPNKPDGMDRNVSHGCLHLYPEDIAKLYGEVAIGTPVRVLKQAAAVQWIGGELFVDIHPNKEQADALDSGAAMPRALPPALIARVTAAAGDAVGRMTGRLSNAPDWSVPAFHRQSRRRIDTQRLGHRSATHRTGSGVLEHLCDPAALRVFGHGCQPQSRSEVA
jgi:hypothetical protein